MIQDLWKALGPAKRRGLVGGAVAIVLAVAALGYWLLRPDFQVLFADLSPQDGSAMVAELERQRIPYALADQGDRVTILVDRKDVYKTRMKLMGKDIPLHGAVGFEIFNGSDLGMTEFAQRINYQRALQGELTRTILGLAEVRDARVHLALAEQGLFKQATSKGKASITLTLRQGAELRAEQVAGIQRLVSSAVPGIATEDVTIVDQRGFALTRQPGDGAVEPGASRLELKREAERYLGAKALELLERALGPGQALVSVDVTLDLDRVQTTIENVVPAQARSGHAPTGVVVRERETLRELASAPASRATADAPALAAGGSTQRELEYVVGRRVEQIVRSPGSVQRLHVVAVVKRPLGPSERSEVERMVASSVGAEPARGDSVVVHSMTSLDAVRAEGGEREAPPATAAVGDSAPVRRGEPAGWLQQLTWPVRIAAAVATALVLAGAAWGVRRGAGRAGPRGAPHPPPQATLSEAERRAALAQVEAWLRTGTAGTAGRRS